MTEWLAAWFLRWRKEIWLEKFSSPDKTRKRRLAASRRRQADDDRLQTDYSACQ
jgi:hypothetical protein